MDATIKKFFTNLAAAWKKTSKGMKFLIIGGTIGVILVSVVVSIILNSINYTQLFSGLSDSESGQIVTQLKAMGVKYKVQGSTIYIDSKKADETRMSLAESGYPQSTFTYSTYTSGNSWAQTDSDKRQLVLYQLQDRLAQTINTIPGVKSSIVTIVDNANNTYVLDSDKVSPTASVKLNLSPGLKLTQSQINGIVQLVSRSVPSLSKDNVAVLNSDGTLLSAAGGLSGSTTDQMQIKNAVEGEIQQKVLSVLTPVFGGGNIQVAASATLDFDQKTTNTTTYTPPNTASSGVGLPSTSSSTATVGGQGSGTAGVNSGQPTYPASSSTSGGGATQSSNQASYLYNMVNQQIQSQGGKITGLSIAVLLNNKSQDIAGLDTDAVVKTIAHAVGLTDPASISVQTIPFITVKQSPTVTPQKPYYLNPQFLMVATGVVAVILILLILLIVLTRKGRKNTAPLPEPVPVAPAPVAIVPDVVAETRTMAAPTSQRSIEETIQEAYDKNTAKKQIADFAEEKPEMVAQLLKSWLKD